MSAETTPYLGPQSQKKSNLSKLLNAPPPRRPFQIQNSRSQLQMSILGKKNRNTAKIELDTFIASPDTFIKSVSKSYSDAITGNTSKKVSVKDMFFAPQTPNSPFSSRPVRAMSAIPTNLRRTLVPSQESSSESSATDDQMIEIDPQDLLNRNEGSQITTAPLPMKDSTTSVFSANEYSSEHSQESWLRYSGRVPERIRKVQQLLTTKAGSLKSTLMCKMNNGNTGGVPPMQFGKNIFACISRMKYVNGEGRMVSFKPGVDYKVFHQAVSGIAEIYAADEFIREKLTATYKFPYHKVLTDANGRPTFGKQEGVFFITQLRQPKQLYDIVGVDYELTANFDQPLKEIFTRLLPQGSTVTINNVNMYNDALNEDGEWEKICVPGPKRVSVECPAGDDAEIPDGPMLLNIPTLGQRVLHTELRRTANLCHLCGGPYTACSRMCIERCRNCGMAYTEGHISEETCPHKDKANTKFAENNINIERSARMDKQLFSDAIDDSLPTVELTDIIAKRRDMSRFQKDIFREQARIAALAMVPAEMRTDLDYSLTSDTEDATYMANRRASELDKTYTRQRQQVHRHVEERRAKEEHVAAPNMSEEERSLYTAELDNAITELFKQEKVTEEKVTEEKVTEEKVTEVKVTEEKVTEEKVTEEKVTMDTGESVVTNKRNHDEVPSSSTDSSSEESKVNSSAKKTKIGGEDDKPTVTNATAEAASEVKENEPVLTDADKHMDIHSVATQVNIKSVITVDDEDIINKSPPQLLSWARDIHLEDGYIGNEMIALSLLFLTELGLSELIKEVAEDFTSEILPQLKTLCPQKGDDIDENHWANSVIGPDQRVYDEFDLITQTASWATVKSKGKGDNIIPEFTNRRTGEPREVKLMVLSRTNLKDYRSVLRDVFNVFPPKPWSLQRDHFSRPSAGNQRQLVLKWEET